MRVIARVFGGGIGKEVEIDAVQFGFVPGRGAADAVRVLKNLHRSIMPILVSAVYNIQIHM